MGHKATQRRQDNFISDDWSEMIFIDFYTTKMDLYIVTYHGFMMAIEMSQKDIL